MTITKRRLQREARREQLLRVAISCYGELGVERAGHGDIAKRAKVSTATVFNYFATREKLTEAVFQEVYNVFDKMFSTITPPGFTPQEHVQKLADSYVFLAQQHPDILKVVLNWSASFGQGVRPQFLKFQEWVLKGIEHHMHKENPDPSDATMILTASYSYARMKLDNTPEAVLDNYVARVIQAVS
ncbi:TetR/AcrR family transcriptional regulator [Hellea sp.]|nr:TetR/AcrR family transcriptional regulator [Hellea sp.]